MSSIYCIGCGQDITSKTADRRDLNNPAAKHVADLLTEFLDGVRSVEGDEFESDLNVSLFTRGKAARICRKCYSAYERFISLRSQIGSNLNSALDVLVPSSSKRIKLDAPTDCSSITLQPSRTTSVSGQSHSPVVSVSIGYKRPKRMMLTPRRKKTAKAVARGSKKAVAEQTFKDLATRKYLIESVGKEIRREIKSISSTKTPTCLRATTPKDLQTFHWEKLVSELSSKAPTLLSILQVSTKTTIPRKNSVGAVCMCAAIILKHHNAALSLVQKLVTVILFAGHASKQTYSRLQRLNLCLSHTSMVTMIDLFGSSHDAKVKQWKEWLTKRLSASPEEDVFRMDPTSLPCASSDSDSDTSTYQSESDFSWMSLSSITSGGESNDSDTCRSDDDDDVIEEEILDVPIPPPLCDQRAVNHSESSPNEEQDVFKKGYRLCGDNVDKSVKHRYMRMDNKSNVKAIHYFNSYATKNRIDTSNLHSVSSCNPSPRSMALTLLPSTDDNSVLHQNIGTIISRVLVDYLPYFKKTFDGVVTWHIPHQYSEEMCAKSEVVPLGILPKNENKSSEMVEILTHLHQYVPIQEYTETTMVPETDESVDVSKAFVHSIFLGGDQLTANRARNAIKAKANEDTPTLRLEGLVAVVEDWHTKLNFLGVIWKYFYSIKSAGDYGTLCHLRNRLNRSNVSNPTKDFNACDDFFRTVVHSHIIAATLEYLEMEKMEDMPCKEKLSTPEDVWMLPDSERKKILREVCHKVVQEYVCFSFNGNEALSDDHLYNYAQQVLSLGCFYLEFCDAIKEGDGERVLRCWKYLLSVFHSSGRTNYTIEALNMLFQYTYRLTPRLRNELLYSRFINVHGRPGKNIPCDLHMEHLNRFAKEAIKGLGANKTEAAIVRVGRALGTIAPVLDNFDDDNNIVGPSGIHSVANTTKDIEAMVSVLSNQTVFQQTPGRSHKTFRKVRNVLHAKGRVETVEWVAEKINTFG